MKHPFKVMSLTAVLVLLCSFTPALAQAQQQQQDQQDVGYTEEEYEAYQKAVNETDLAKRADMLLEFLRSNPDSKLNEHVILAYKALYKQLGEDNRKIAAAAEKYLAYDPNDLISLAAAVEAYHKLGDSRKFVEYAEKFYAKQPSKNAALTLAKEYQKMGNNEKFVEWAEKTLQYYQDGNYDYPAVTLLVDLVRVFGDQNKIDQATKYARLVVKSIGSIRPPEGVSPKDWKEYVDASLSASNFLLGEDAYQRDRWKEAAQHYERVIGIKKDQFLAYYRLAFCYWRMQKTPDDVMLAFAKAALLAEKVGNRKIAADARQRVEEIYKPLHNNTTIGIDKVWNKARQQLEAVGAQ